MANQELITWGRGKLQEDVNAWVKKKNVLQPGEKIYVILAVVPARFNVTTRGVRCDYLSDSLTDNDWDIILSSGAEKIYKPQILAFLRLFKKYNNTAVKAYRIKKETGYDFGYSQTVESINKALRKQNLPYRLKHIPGSGSFGSPDYSVRMHIIKPKV